MASKSEFDLCRVPLRILVVGAGLAGLSAAVSLAHRGHSVLVLESTKELQSIGAGVGVPPPTKQWYESEGVLQSDDPAWASTRGFETRSWDTGEVLAQTDTATPVSIHRGDLQLALFSHAQKLGNFEIRLDSRVVDINTEIDRPAVHIATGERITGDLIIVADGVKSKLKWKISPSKSEMAEPTGDAAYRLVIPRQLLDNDERLMPLVEESWIRRWGGPNAQIIAYPIHNYELLNVVLLHSDDGRAEESWTSMTEKHHIVADFQGWDSVIQKLVNLAPAKVPNFRILTHSPSQTWVKGSAILLGDACHAMPPHLGAGVSQAVEDATAITAVLSAIESKQQLPAALKAYETSRKDHVTEIQAATLKVKQVYRKDGEGQAAAPDKDKGNDQDKEAEAKVSEKMVKAMRAAWKWDAAEAARTALADILKSS